MKILVTGGSGFIGSQVVDKLADAGHEVRVMDIKIPHRGDIEFFRGDITSMADVEKGIAGIEAVYHIAAFANIDLVKDHPLTTIERNIMGTAYLLEECRRQQVKRFLFASSVYAYEGRGHLYTTGKVTSEMLCRDYNTLYSLPYTILRYGTAYGPRSRGADVISLFVNRAINGKNLVIRGSGEQKRHFTYVEDLARGSVATLKPAAENKTYTLATREPVSIKGLAELVKRMFNNKIAIEYDSAREDDYREELADLDKARNELGWEPEIDLEEGIRRYIEWYKENAAR